MSNIKLTDFVQQTKYSCTGACGVALAETVNRYLDEMGLVKAMYTEGLGKGSDMSKLPAALGDDLWRTYDFWDGDVVTNLEKATVKGQAALGMMVAKDKGHTVLVEGRSANGHWKINDPGVQEGRYYELSDAGVRAYGRMIVGRK